MNKDEEIKQLKATIKEQNEKLRLHSVSKSFIFMKQTWLDVYFGRFKWYRKMKKGIWYKHQFTKDAEELTFPQGDTWWARYGKINRYSDVITTEVF